MANRQLNNQPFFFFTTSTNFDKAFCIIRSVKSLKGFTELSPSEHLYLLSISLLPKQPIANT